MNYKDLRALIADLEERFDTLERIVLGEDDDGEETKEQEGEGAGEGTSSATD